MQRFGFVANTWRRALERIRPSDFAALGYGRGWGSRQTVRMSCAETHTAP